MPDMDFFMRPVVFYIAILLLPLQTAKAQGGVENNFKKKKEQAIGELKKYTKADTNRVNALLKVLSTAIYLKEKNEVILYLPEAMELSRKLDYKTGLANSYLQRASFYKSASDYSNSILYYDSALYIAGKKPGWDLLSIKEVALEVKGIIYFTLENYYPALDFLFEALKNLRADKQKRKIRIYTVITQIYTSLYNLEKAEEYALKSVALTDLDTTARKDIAPYFAYIDVCLEKNDLKTATEYLNKMSTGIPHPTEVQENFGYYHKRGRISYLLLQYPQAYLYFKEAYKYALEGGHQNSKSTSLYYLSATALQLGYKDEAKKYALQNLALAENMKTMSPKIDALINLSNYYNKAGNETKAYQLIKQAMQLKDSFNTQNNITQLNAIGAIYEYGKQQTEIAELQNEKEKQLASVKQKSLLNNVFIASIIGLLFLGYLGFTNFKKGQQLAKQQQAIQDQKIIELEKNRQLNSIDAMLKGQEEERSRIAKDLHDGVGSLLSGTKMSFMHVKEAVVLSNDSRILFEKSLSMLDNTIGDLRKVAQNLMPEALVKFGLQEALRDFCDSIQSSSGIKLLYQQFGEKRKLSSTAEVFTYRIIQELVNNAVKHAEASQIIVQLSIGNRKTAITVEDNGKGFDKAILRNSKGAGQANINYRVQYFNGTCDIVTSPDRGTSVSIELKA